MDAPDPVPDDYHLTPLTSYGTQKAICELLISDYSRKRMIDGLALRLPTVCGTRPGWKERDGISRRHTTGWLAHSAIRRR